jgi:hypothetical protein
VLTEHHRIKADSINLVASMRIPTTPDSAIQRSTCRDHYLDGDLDTLAQWFAAGPSVKLGRGNFVEFPESVRARPQRAARL